MQILYKHNKIGTLLGVYKERNNMKAGTLRIVRAIGATGKPVELRLAKTKFGIYNIPVTSEDCKRTFEMLGNKHMHVIVTEPKSDNPANVGDLIYDVTNNAYCIAKPTTIDYIRANPDYYERVLLEDGMISRNVLDKIVVGHFNDGDDVSVSEVGDVIKVKEESK